MGGRQRTSLFITTEEEARRLGMETAEESEKQQKKSKKEKEK